MSRAGVRGEHAGTATGAPFNKLDILNWLYGWPRCTVEKGRALTPQINALTEIADVV